MPSALKVSKSLLEPGSVTCPASASRPTLGNVEVQELFKEAGFAQIFFAVFRRQKDRFQLLDIRHQRILDSITIYNFLIKSTVSHDVTMFICYGFRHRSSLIFIFMDQVDRGSAAPSDAFLQSGPRPTNAWCWSSDAEYSMVSTWQCLKAPVAPG